MAVRPVLADLDVRLLTAYRAARRAGLVELARRLGVARATSVVALSVVVPFRDLPLLQSEPRPVPSRADGAR